MKKLKNIALTLVFCFAMAFVAAAINHLIKLNQDHKIDWSK